MIDFAPLHNQSWDVTSVLKHYYEHHYLVDAIELVHGDLRAKRCYNQLHVHWYILWLKTLLISFLHLHKCHATWYARIKMLSELMQFLQSDDLWTNHFQERRNDMNMGFNDSSSSHTSGGSSIGHHQI